MSYPSEKREISEILKKFSVAVKTKADNPQRVIQQILRWTKGDKELTKKLCQLILNSELTFPADREPAQLKFLIEGYAEITFSKKLKQINPSKPIICGHYQIEKELGQGNRLKTYQAIDLNLPDVPWRVILEVNPLTDIPSQLQELENKFNQETQKLFKLGSHLQIPTVFGRFLEKKKLYLILEFIAGESIEQELKSENQLTELNTKKILLEILKILVLVHQEDMIHGNLKPSSLIRREQDGKIVLTDFAVVRTIVELTNPSEDNSTLDRSLSYIAPEQKAGNLQLSSDLYSVGMIGIQALTGLEPEKLSSDSQTQEVIWGRWSIDISSDFAEFLNKMVRFNPSDRYQSAAEALAALQNLMPRELTINWRIPSLIAGGLCSLAIGVWGVQLLVPKPPEPLTEDIDFSALDNSYSYGEESIFNKNISTEKQEGFDHFNLHDYEKAQDAFQRAWDKEKNKDPEEKKYLDPETLIYLNNSRILAGDLEHYTVAIVVPANHIPDEVKETNKAILRGIAQAQNRIYTEVKSNNYKKALKVLIVNDDSNNDDLANREAIEERALALVGDDEVIAAIGHRSSGNVAIALPIYQKNKFPLIASTSTADTLSESCKKQKKCFFFRIPAPDRDAVIPLAEYLSEHKKLSRVAIFYSPNSTFSESFKKAFETSFKEKNGRIVEEFKLNKANFDIDKSLKQAKGKKAESIILIPDVNSIDKAYDIIRNNEGYFILGLSESLYATSTLTKVDSKDVEKGVIMSPHWHSLKSCQTQLEKDFCDKAIDLWGTKSHSWRMATTYDAALVLVKALEQISQNHPKEDDIKKLRSLLRDQLADPDFKVTGVTGKIDFDPKTGDRKKPPEQLVTIVFCKTSDEKDYEFAPVTKNPVTEEYDITYPKCPSSEE
ncbi:MAG: ABC transporter substrate-binding protein [Cyanobacteria bacterium SBLK]|nr:ABC transporter substrate-binding protein [Cyanobacteria bacterium SBLK]